MDWHPDCVAFLWHSYLRGGVICVICAQARKYEGFTDCFQDILRRDGYRGLYRGILPNAMKVLPAASISYTIFDILNGRAL